jgi:hypothetical protein
MAERSKPKRHHWWPIAQSKHWVGADGLIFVTNRLGQTFKANPTNIGVESELYTRFIADDSKDTTIEDWFSRSIDSSLPKFLEYLRNPGNSQRVPLPPVHQSKKQELRELGFRPNNFIDEIPLPLDVRHSIADYVAAILVRNPTYLRKLGEFHQEAFDGSDGLVKTIALDNMLFLHDIYSAEIMGSVLVIGRPKGSTEYIHADGGLEVSEPWSREGALPFSLHAPITPDLAIEVLPLRECKQVRLDAALVIEASNRGVARHNRVTLGAAQRFVFSRQSPPTKFIVSNFGVPAPKQFGSRIVNGELETIYDPTRR